MPLKKCSDGVRELLCDIPGTEGTQAFLKVMNHSYSSLVKKNMALEERIYRIWYSVFFLRIWKRWISKHPNWTVTDNFITTNCYSAIEINAHNLIELVRVFRDDPNLNEKMFIPYLFNSQMCEKIFRATRSLTSTVSLEDIL